MTKYLREPPVREQENFETPAKCQARDVLCKLSPTGLDSGRLLLVLRVWSPDGGHARGQHGGKRTSGTATEGIYDDAVA